VFASCAYDSAVGNVSRRRQWNERLERSVKPRHVHGSELAAAVNRVRGRGELSQHAPAKRTTPAAFLACPRSFYSSLCAIAAMRSLASSPIAV